MYYPQNFLHRFRTISPQQSKMLILIFDTAASRITHHYYIPTTGARLETKKKNIYRFRSSSLLWKIKCVTNISDACKLPQVKGACVGYHLRWYYDSAREQCGQFVFGGCLGNANNFDTRELCQERCEPARSAGNFNLYFLM